jgi:hypothetical protein
LDDFIMPDELRSWLNARQPDDDRSGDDGEIRSGISIENRMPEKTTEI